MVEAGCGWGALGLHMARHYGVKVRAFNISHEQIVYARERAQAEGLASRSSTSRMITATSPATTMRSCRSACSSTSAVENYPELGRIAQSDACRATAAGLIHSIGRNHPAPLHPWIERRIFPGAYPPSLAEMMQIFEPWDLSVLDVENLRLHYAQTLRHWLALYEAARGAREEHVR